MYSRYRRRPKWLDILGLQESKTNVIKWQKPGLFILLTLGLATTLYISNSNKLNNVHSLEPRSIGASRRLLETENSTESSGHGPQWEQCDFETGTSSGAWIFNHAMCILFIFVALAIVCDDFFVPSLEAISEKLHLSEDVAGATFMAAGSSAPELFTSVAGVAVQTDVGVGTIVGSAVFNLLIIIALTAALAGQVLHLDWRPMARDSFFYAMSIGCFIGFAWDGYFMHYEAVIFLILYALYIVLMVFNPRVMDWMATWRCCCGQKVEPADGEAGEGEKETNLNSSTTKLQNETDERKEDDDDDEEEETMNICPCLPCCCPIRTRPPNSDQAKKEGGCANWSKLIVRWILFFPAFPFVVLFSWTIPDCSKEHNKKYYILSFVMSVVWIAILSFAMVTLVGRTGCILGVDSYVMGLVVVAIGTSIPDALSSVLVARDGYGDMAVSNAIGSNVFDINLGLGLPFIIRIAIDKGAPIVLLQDDEWVDFYTGHMPIMPHAKFGFILLIILAIALVVFGLAKFRLNKYIGVAFVIMYVIFLIYAFMQELYCVRVLELYC